MITILGRLNSSNVQKVLWCLEEVDVPYQREEVAGKGPGERTAEYLDLNPNGLIPTLIDGSTPLWESNTICRYLAARYGAGSLWEPVPLVRAAGEKWMDWQLTTLAPPMTPLFVQLVRTTPAERDDAIVKTNQDKAAKAFRILDAALARTPWLGNQSFTVADIPCGVMAYRYLNLPIERPALPALADWYARLAERPAFRKAVMVGLS